MLLVIRTGDMHAANTTLQSMKSSSSLKKILDLAKEHVQPARRGTSATTKTGLVEEDAHVDDQRTLLIDISDDENSLSSFLSSLVFCNSFIL